MSDAFRRTPRITPAIAALAALAVIGGFAFWYQSRSGGGAERALAFGLRALRPGEDPAAYVREQFFTCFGQNLGYWRSPCYRAFAQALIGRFGFAGSLSAIKSVETEPGIDGQCHSFVHLLAHEEFRRTQSLPETFAQCRIVCGEGCYHGTVEAYVREQGLGGAADETFAEAIRRSCEAARADPRRIIYQHCIHGLGHAFALAASFDLSRSLALCDRFAPATPRDQCWSGVFMEYVFSEAPSGLAELFGPDDPVSPCTAFAPRYRGTCYGAQAAFFLDRHRNDWAGAADLCSRTVPPPYRRECFAAIGAGAVLPYRQDLAMLKRVCDVAPAGELRSGCLEGSIAFLSFAESGDPVRIAAYCRAVASGDREGCFRFLGVGVTEWFPQEQRDEQCRRVGPDPKEQHWCRAGLAVD